MDSEEENNMSGDSNQMNDTTNDESGSLPFEDEDEEVLLMSKLFDLQKIEQHLSSQVSYKETVVTNLRREAEMQNKIYADLRDKNEQNEILDRHLGNLQEASIHASCSREKQEILAKYKMSSISVVPKTESDAYKEYKILKADLDATQARYENSELNIKVVDMESKVREHEIMLGHLESQLKALKKEFYDNEEALKAEYNTMILGTVKISMNIYNNSFKAQELSKEKNLLTITMCETNATFNETEITLKTLTAEKELSATPPLPLPLLDDLPLPNIPYPEFPIRFMLSQPSIWNNIIEKDTTSSRIIEENSLCESIVTSQPTENMETTFQNMSFVESENNCVVNNHEKEFSSELNNTSEDTVNLTAGIHTVTDEMESIQQQYNSSKSSDLFEIEENNNSSRRIPTVTNTPKNSREKEIISPPVKLKQREEIYKSSPFKRRQSVMSDFLQEYNENNFSKMSGTPKIAASKSKPTAILRTPTSKSKQRGILKTPASNSKPTGILKTPASNSKPAVYNQDRSSYLSEEKSESQRYTNVSVHRMEIGNSQKRQQSQSNAKVVESTTRHLQAKKQLYSSSHDDKTNNNPVAQQVKKHHSQTIPERTQSRQKKKCFTQIPSTNRMSSQPPPDPSRYQRDEPVRKKMKKAENKFKNTPEKQHNVIIAENVLDEGSDMELSFENIIDDHNQNESESCLFSDALNMDSFEGDDLLDMDLPNSPTLSMNDFGDSLNGSANISFNLDEQDNGMDFFSQGFKPDNQNNNDSLF